jgi:hypothetical protein
VVVVTRGHYCREPAVAADSPHSHCNKFESALDHGCVGDLLLPPPQSSVVGEAVVSVVGAAVASVVGAAVASVVGAAVASSVVGSVAESVVAGALVEEVVGPDEALPSVAPDGSESSADVAEGLLAAVAELSEASAGAADVPLPAVAD